MVIASFEFPRPYPVGPKMLTKGLVVLKKSGGKETVRVNAISNVSPDWEEVWRCLFAVLSLPFAVLSLSFRCHFAARSLPFRCPFAAALSLPFYRSFRRRRRRRAGRSRTAPPLREGKEIQKRCLSLRYYRLKHGRVFTFAHRSQQLLDGLVANAAAAEVLRLARPLLSHRLLTAFP